jgi:hypothetical protein
MNIAVKIRNLAATVLADPQKCSASDVVDAIILLLGETVLEDPAECEKLAEWEDEVRGLVCKLKGEHSWLYDHCGFWGHQYCWLCRDSKYPELGSLACCKVLLGDMTEAEYQATEQFPPPCPSVTAVKHPPLNNGPRP